MLSNPASETPEDHDLFEESIPAIGMAHQSGDCSAARFPLENRHPGRKSPSNIHKLRESSSIA
jgi:hypothetical protein